MIIWGSRGVSKTLSSGSFLCPRCATEQPYERKKSTRFFTLYFIPLIPMGDLGEYVECRGCKGTFVPQVLTMDRGPDPAEARRSVLEALCVALAYVANADGKLSGVELAAIVAGLRREFDAKENDALIESKIERAAKDHPDFRAAIGPLAEHLTDKGRELVLRLAIETARADGDVNEAETRAIRELGEALQMSTAHVRGVLAEAGVAAIS